MPPTTECQLDTDALLDAQITFESDSGTKSNSESECKMDGWDESLPPLSNVFLQVVLLDVYKEQHKVIFQSYLHLWP